MYCDMYNEFLTFAIELANEAGKFIRPHAGKAGHQNAKSAKDFVTEMDLQSENLIIEKIKTQFPTHNIFSEEIGRIKGSDDYEWVIDPIDGTVNYSVDLPFYGVSIALTHRGEPIIGVISLPAFGETFWAAKGEGAYLNGERIKVRETSLSESFVSFGDFAKDGDREANRERINLLNILANEVYRIRMVGTAALSLSYIAAGRLDAAIYRNINYYDIAAGELLIKEAGGVKFTKGHYTYFANAKVANELIDLEVEAL